MASSPLFQYGDDIVRRLGLTFVLLSVLIAIQVKCSNAQLTTIAQGDSRTLLQADGSSELVERFRLQLPNGIHPTDIEYYQKSTNVNCLDVTQDRNIIPTRTGNFLNVTSTLTFDKLPGVTTYTIGVRKRGTDTPLYETSITYTVVGFSLYKKRPSGGIEVISGDSNIGYQVPFDKTSKKQIDPEDKIYVFIQYPDGTNSNNLPQSTQRVPLANTFISKIESSQNQLNHDPQRCNIDRIGTYSSSDGILLPTGCGFGFYRDAPGHLLFGFKWIPYRVGPLRLHFTWPGLTAINTDLSEESFESNLKAEVTGTPPIVVTKVEPIETLFRTEGGQPVQITFVNGAQKQMSDLRIQIQPGTFARLVPGTVSPVKEPERTQTAVCVVEPGTGGPYEAVVQYQEPGKPGASGTPTNATNPPGTSGALPGTTENEPWRNAVMNVPFKPMYDEKTLFIESMTPASGNEAGNTPITLTGYFSNFEPNRDYVAFSGIRIPSKNIEYASPDTIKFKLPPRETLGNAPEYQVTVTVGNGISNRVRFFYLVNPDDLSVEIISTGTTDNGDNRLRISPCTRVSFTAIATPSTKQVNKLEWHLTTGDSLATNLFTSNPALKSVDTSADTISLSPDQFGQPGTYILSAILSLDGGIVRNSVVLLRDNTPAPGVTLLNIPKRRMSMPMSPVRVNAVVTSPGTCYSGDQSLRFEWEVFSQKYDFMPSEATGDARPPPQGVHPCRLGRELVIPQKSLKPGVHNVTLNVWLGNATEPSGIATTTFEVTAESLVPVIRNGEVMVETSAVTDLEIFGTNSYDPDVLGPKSNDGISYKWSCHVSETPDFAKKSNCPTSCMPSNAKSSPAFTILKEQIAKLNSKQKYLRYNLQVSRGPKKATTSMDVKVSPNGLKPMLMDYLLALEDTDGNPINPEKVPTYYTVVLKTSAPTGSKWTYEIVDPEVQDFQFADMLAKGPTLYSLTDKKNGNTKSIGFAANKLSSFKPYKVKVNFAETATTAPTSVVYEFKTMETPRLGGIKLIPSAGDTATLFTTTAGLPISDDRFSYYFYVTDSEGNEICVGGCTGHHVTYFTLNTPGTYTLKAKLFDKRGYSLLDEKILSQPLVIKESGNEKDVIKLLPLSFKTGDDATWIQVANDLSIAAADNSPSRAALEMIFGLSYDELATNGVLKPNTSPASIPSPEPVPESTPESNGNKNSQSANVEQYGRQRNAARSIIASGVRKIICSTTPNSQMGRNVLKLVKRTLSAPYVSVDTWYDLLFITKCAIENSSPSDNIDADDLVPSILGDLYKHAQSLDKSSASRAKARSNNVAIGSLSADAATIVGELIVGAFGKGKLDGYKMSKDLGPSGKFGYVSMFVGSKPDQMDLADVNGQSRRVVKGKTKNEVFYIHNQREEIVFPNTSTDEKRFILLHSTPNFVKKSNLQPEPAGGNLDDNIYWTQIYGKSNNGRLQRLVPRSDEPTFCMRLPITKKNKFFTTSVSRMPGMYAHRNIKPIGVQVKRKGEYFNYEYGGTKVIEYQVSDTTGWVEACHIAPNLFGATSIDKSTDGAARSIGVQGAILIGDNGILIPYLVGSALLLAMLLIMIAWLVAIKSGGDSADTDGAAAGGGFVDRDTDGRQAAAAVMLNGHQPTVTAVSAT